MDRQTVAIEVKKALSETVLLSDGRQGYIITEVHENGQDKWECHVCSRIIATERAMLMHLSHPLHMSKMRASHHPAENFKKKKPKDERQRKSSELGKGKKEENLWEGVDTVTPGEPVPPGMEDIVKEVCQIQDTLDNYHGPLIGVEYIVELVSTEEPGEPKYICLLCEKKGDPRSVMVHLTSHNHALRYISCFFRTAGNALNMIPKVRENRKGVAMAVQKIAEEIERNFGRLKPISAAAETFTQHKFEILRSIDEKEHFRETPTTTFTEYCTPEKIKEYSSLAEAEINALKKTNKISNIDDDDDDDRISSTKRSENGSGSEIAELRSSDQPTKFSFSIGKPERSFGRNKSSELINSPEKKDDDEVIFVASSNEPIEIHSMSSISSESDYESKSMTKHRNRSRSRSRGRARRRPSPMRRRTPPRRRSPMYRDSHYRSRSRSRSRGHYYREKDRSRALREMDRIYGRAMRSRSKERIRYERMRSERDRYRRSISLERERRRISPRSLKELSPSAKMKRLKSPDLKKKKVVSEYRAKMDAYRAKLHELEVEMDNKLKYYRERPEKHPMYSDEWKSFWNRRYKELQQAGKDPTGYDFKPEWIVFWDERVKKVHEEELAAKKDELKSMLPIDKGPSHDLQDISPPTPESSKDVTVDDIKNTWKALTGSEIKAPAKTRSISPDARSPVSRKSPSPWEERTERSKLHRKPAATYVADPPIVHCLRMLSVLETQLGSLGPKALELLSKAILMEKVKHNESMTLLQDPDIHIFFETVKEKIRGQLIAGIVVRHLVNSCRSLITAIENMVAANPLKPKAIVQPKPTFTPIQPEPVEVAGVGLVNKMAVAQQIAEILVAQGRTDVSQQELEDLINAVVGIATTSNTNVNQPPASFFRQLNIQKSTASSHINALLSNLISSAQQSATPQVITPVEPVIPGSLNPSVPEEPISALQTPLIRAPSVSTLINTVSAIKTAKASVSEDPLVPVHPVEEVKQRPLFPLDEPSPFIETEKGNKKISDDELKERLMKFKTLSRDEQQSLIALLKELENKEPERVEKLRKYVAVGLTQSSSTPSTTRPESDSGRLSPFSSRAGGTNPAPEEKKKLFVDSDHEDDDDDYDVEDVYKSVSEKLKKKENERKSDFRINPDELFDENSSASHHSYSNPSKPLSPSPFKENSVNTDPRLKYLGDSGSNTYTAYPVGETHNRQPPAVDVYSHSSDRFLPPVAQQSENSFNNSQWSGSKTWSQGPQEAYSPAGRLNPYPSTYSQGVPTYKAGSYFGGGPSDKSYTNPAFSNPPTYQSGPAYINSAAPPPNYSYQRPQGQGGYYSNYRQY